MDTGKRILINVWLFWDDSWTSIWMDLDTWGAWKWPNAFKNVLGNYAINWLNYVSQKTYQSLWHFLNFQKPLVTVKQQIWGSFEILVIFPAYVWFQSALGCFKLTGYLNQWMNGDEKINDVTVGSNRQEKQMGWLVIQL